MKTCRFLFLSLITYLLFSCADEVGSIDSSQNVQLKSNITNAIFEDVANKLYERLNSTRGNEEVNFSEEDAQQILKPFIADGEELRNSLMSQIILAEDKMGLMKDEVDGLASLGDDDLALLSFIVYEMGKSETKSRAAVSSQLISCLEVAVGISSIKEMWISGLVNAKTITQALIAQGKRYLGYVGVALVVYSFVDCVS